LVEVIVKKDYDGFFEAFVWSLIDEKGGKTKHKKIVITAGPYRAYVVRYEDAGDTLYLDFYSAFRVGFGTLTREEREKLKELL